MTGIVQLACRHEMVIDEDRLVRIPDLGKSHLFELVFYKRDKNIVDHDAVHIDRDDIAGLYGSGTDVMCEYLFN